MIPSATDLIRLWLDNDQGLYDLVREIASTDCYASEAGDDLQEHIRQNVGLDSMEAGIASDLLTRALASVDWTQIIKDAREEMKSDG